MVLQERVTMGGCSNLAPHFSFKGDPPLHANLHLRAAELEEVGPAHGEGARPELAGSEPSQAAWTWAAP